MTPLHRAFAAVALLAWFAAGCGADGSPAALPEQLGVEVLARHPHDPAMFTQGLLLDGADRYESGGGYGTSSITVTDHRTGVLLRRRDLPDELFAEGIAKVGDRLIVLTWRERTALVLDARTLVELDRYRYETEGWGLCDDGARLVMTDGSDTLFFRDRDTFSTLGSVRVTRAGAPLRDLNELECVGDEVYANVWRTDTIVRIDPGTGQVTAEIDAAGLLAPHEQPQDDDAVLNGIAYDAGTDTFVLTGKRWPALFDVRFVAKG